MSTTIFAVNLTHFLLFFSESIQLRSRARTGPSVWRRRDRLRIRSCRAQARVEVEEDPKHDDSNSLQEHKETDRGGEKGEAGEESGPRRGVLARGSVRSLRNELGRSHEEGQVLRHGLRHREQKELGVPDDARPGRALLAPQPLLDEE